MSNTVNNGIPFVPENTIDPAAGLNESLLTVDALLQLAVVSVGDNAPPGSPANGARYIVGTAPTGAWAGRANQVAQWLDGGWRFYAARYALNTADGLVYVRQGATWSVAAAEWTAATVSQAEAEAGTATARRAWTAQRVRQAIIGWWSGATSAFGRGLVAAADAAAGRTALGLGTASTRAALGSTGALYSRDSILGTVSQSAGVPTGAIVERGSNANGEYVRFADGTQICSGISYMTTDTAYGSTGLYYSVYPALTTLPASFADASYRVTSAGTSTNILPGGATPDSGSAFRIAGMYPADAAVIGVYWIAIGRWY